MGRALAALWALIFAASPAYAQTEEFLWCVKMDVFTKNCAFASYNDCAAVAKNADATCIRNPDYKPPAVTAVRPKPAASKPAQPQR